MDMNTVGNALMQPVGSGANPAIDDVLARSGVTVPPVMNIPQVDPQMLQQRFQQAMSGQLPQAGDEAKSAALLKLGLSLMQAPQAGQTNAGHLAQSVGGAFDQMQASRSAEAQRNMQQLELGLKMQTMQQGQQEWRVKMATALEQLRTLPEEQRVKLQKTLMEAEYYRAKGDEATADAALKRVQAESAPEESQALVNSRNAAANASAANAERDRAAVGAAKVEQKYKVTNLGDGNALLSEMDDKGQLVKATTISLADAAMVSAEIAQEVKAGTLKKEEAQVELAKRLQPQARQVGGVGTAPVTAPAAAPAPVAQPITRDQLKSMVASRAPTPAPVAPAAPVKWRDTPVGRMPVTE